MSGRWAARCPAPCLAQISVNASQVADGVYDDEHVHQLRIGLRRLRTALRIFGADDSSELAIQAAVLFRRFGAARDQAAIAGPLERALNDALAGADLPFRAPALPQEEPEADPTVLMRLGPAQALLLDLLALAQSDASPVDAPGLREALAGIDRGMAVSRPSVSTRWRRTPRRHVRKGLRYGIEFA